jgi:predicted nucleic acid-binding protein
MTPVFLDTVGLIAVWDRTDQWHDAAAKVYAELLHEGRPLISTSLVFFECGNASARRPYRSRVNVLRQALAEMNLLIDPTSDDIDAAWLAFDRGDGGGAGIVDQVSFAIMQRLGLMDAFTNDRHFQAAGFATLF